MKLAGGVRDAPQFHPAAVADLLRSTVRDTLRRTGPTEHRGRDSQECSRTLWAARYRALRGCGGYENIVSLLPGASDEEITRRLGSDVIGPDVTPPVNPFGIGVRPNRRNGWSDVKDLGRAVGGFFTSGGDAVDEAAARASEGTPIFMEPSEARPGTTVRIVVDEAAARAGVRADISDVLLNDEATTPANAVHRATAVTRYGWRPAGRVVAVHRRRTATDSTFLTTCWSGRSSMAATSMRRPADSIS